MVYPVVTGLGVDAESGVFFGCISEERLQEGTADTLTIFVARVGPDLVGEHAIGPAFILAERHDSRAEPPFLRAQHAFSRRRKIEIRPDAPDESCVRGREEETQRRVAQSALAAGADAILLINIRNDSTRDDIPAFVE